LQYLEHTHILQPSEELPVEEIDFKINNFLRYQSEEQSEPDAHSAVHICIATTLKYVFSLQASYQFVGWLQNLQKMEYFAVLRMSGKNFLQ
jgi:hypothetical protein